MSVHNLNSVKDKQLSSPPIQTLFEGTYRVANKKTGRNNNGGSYVHIELHDSTATKVGQCHPTAISWYQNTPYQLANVKGFFLHSDNQKMMHITEIKPINSAAANPMLYLPRALCADATWLDRLISIRQSIQSPALVKFVDAVFSDDEIALAFLQVPASRKHHHNHASGLLEHSIEVAETVSHQQCKNTGERDISIVAALLHDIGKVKTLQANINSTTLGKMVSHDDLTLELCAPALKHLDKEWSDAALTLRHVWNCASTGARYGFKRNSTIANFLQFADKLSVDRFDESIAFKKSNETTGFAWDGAKYYWRPKPGKTNIERRRFRA